MIELPPVHAAVIREEAAIQGLPVLLLFALAYGESGWVEHGAGDGGTSRGYFQVHVPVHGLPAHGWVGIEGTRAAMRLMGPRWLTTYASMGGDLAFSANPTAFLCRWWPRAQGAEQPEWARCGEAITAAQGMEDRMAVVKPPILWLPADERNVRSRPAGVQYEGIAAHTTAGSSTIEQLANWFGGANIAAGMYGSTHFGVDRAGRIGQFVSLERQAIAHGQEPGSTAKLVRDNPGLSSNSYLIGIEHLDAGTPGNVTPAQLSASVHLAAWLWETVIEPAAPVTGAVLDHDHILQHRDLAPASRPHCASWPEDRMTAYIARVRAMLAPPVPPPPVIDWHARYTALANEVLVWQQDDAAGAEMRRDRLQEMTHG